MNKRQFMKFKKGPVRFETNTVAWAHNRAFVILNIVPQRAFITLINTNMFSIHYIGVWTTWLENKISYFFSPDSIYDFYQFFLVLKTDYQWQRN